MKRTFATYETESAAIADMKRRRKRKYTVTYSEYWKCFVCWFNA
jgi:hypothetical protein